MNRQVSVSQELDSEDRANIVHGMRQSIQNCLLYSWRLPSPRRERKRWQSSPISQHVRDDASAVLNHRYLKFMISLAWNN